MTDFLLKLIAEKLYWVYPEMPIKEWIPYIVYKGINVPKIDYKSYLVLMVIRIPHLLTMLTKKWKKRQILLWVSFLSSVIFAVTIHILVHVNKVFCVKKIYCVTDICGFFFF